MRLPFRRLSLTVSLSLFLAAAAEAQTAFVGPRMTAMAGAYTALSDDGVALWTNPAAFAADANLHVQLFGSALIADSNGFVDRLDAVSNVELAKLRKGEDFSRVPGIASTVARLAEPGTGLLTSAAGGGVYGRGRWAFGAGDLAFAGVYPVVDLVHVRATTDPATGVGFNATRTQFVGLEAREARIAYATRLFLPGLYFGGTLRAIRGRTTFASRSLFGDDRNLAQLARDAFRDNAEESTRAAFDVGVLWKIAKAFRVAAVATAVNEPSFRLRASAPGSVGTRLASDVKLPRTVRVGAAFAPPLLGLAVAGDIDVVRAKTLVPGRKSRRLSFGAEKSILLVTVRAGAFRDLEAPDPHWAYTAGVGIGTKTLSVNAAAIYSAGERDVGAGVDLRVRL